MMREVAIRQLSFGELFDWKNIRFGWARNILRISWICGGVALFWDSLRNVRVRDGGRWNDIFDGGLERYEKREMEW